MFNKIEYTIDFNDILIKPVVTSDIISRTDVNPFDEFNMLPLFTAPMDTVINNDNSHKFNINRINICMSRGQENSNSSFFKSYSLNEFIFNFIDNKVDIAIPQKVLIDTANGHIKEMVDVVIEAKKIYGKEIILMVGNIANPETYVELSNAGASYVRVGIGGGNSCITSVQTGVGFPMASLINECYNYSLGLDFPAKIVADGGMQNYSDIIKALALGADYVMVGSIFNKCIESAGSNYIFKRIPVTQCVAEYLYGRGMKIHKKFRGMSTKEVQKSLGNDKLKTSEGVIRYRPVEYTINGWVENFEAYLRSAMSYTNAKTLKDFIGETEIIQISDNAYKRIKK